MDGWMDGWMEAMGIGDHSVTGFLAKEGEGREGRAAGWLATDETGEGRGEDGWVEELLEAVESGDSVGSFCSGGEDGWSDGSCSLVHVLRRIRPAHK